MKASLLFATCLALAVALPCAPARAELMARAEATAQSPSGAATAAAPVPEARSASSGVTVTELVLQRGSVELVLFHPLRLVTITVDGIEGTLHIAHTARARALAAELSAKPDGVSSSATRAALWLQGLFPEGGAWKVGAHAAIAAGELRDGQVFSFPFRVGGGDRAVTLPFECALEARHWNCQAETDVSLSAMGHRPPRFFGLGVRDRVRSRVRLSFGPRKEG